MKLVVYNTYIITYMNTDILKPPVQISVWYILHIPAHGQNTWKPGCITGRDSTINVHNYVGMGYVHKCECMGLPDLLVQNIICCGQDCLTWRFFPT